MAASTEIILAAVVKLHFSVELEAFTKEEKSTLPLPSQYQLFNCFSSIPVSPTKVCAKICTAELLRNFVLVSAESISIATSNQLYDVFKKFSFETTRNDLLCLVLSLIECGSLMEIMI
ncbi:hypothetical protein AVEN_122934-1 [Araneus ventricosus]|uniref:Uncharacterized protein n=1 Tax=Araneus ventricosus TaxID=182803 RepID=A0A4Y2S1M0_ARAVE|nr:hypothetical protein AVEN_268000-1 [Araneus ventricosus]GBN81892.1 hypothetical protein AVEN_53700-1 [Araneus ventricosus]GBN81905.1 hypothetical protein AVEN_116480-1 [Araneus ventricosus]GBN81909.1 hypothetical protein AVEN_122934-1 [Araneus ventricosus]